ncbi:MAG TPA: hypothetical protein VJP02_29550 [Candidatus Sulfotelmatobacter sp.]|nr:hypothetical protein [Candidatus Sulfotelmatobacter sp.]
MSQISWSAGFFSSLGLGVIALHRLALPPAIRYLVPIVPLVAGSFYIRALIRDIRGQMDELQLRIYLEAAAVAVCGLFIVMLAYPLLQEAGVIGRLDYWVVLLLLGVLGAAGYANARWRYR